MSIALRVLLLAALAGPARADLNDPPPTIDGVKTKHVYSITGVVGYQNLGTMIHCTSLHKEGTAVVAVQAYGDVGALVNDVASGEGVVSDVPPGGSSAIAIAASGDLIAGFFWNYILNNATIGRGSARVLSDRPVLCTAAVVDVTSNPPVSMMPLHVFKKNKQKGD